jgi:hypothetical protein
MKPIIESYQKLAMTLALSLVGTALQAQLIDPLDGTGGISYTTYLVNDVSAGAGRGVSFTQSSSGLQANYVGTGTSAEQALSLASATAFSTTFSVGDILYVNSTVAASSTAEDLGLAISANNPSAGTSGNSYNSRGAFDWLSISVRPNDTAPGGPLSSIRVNTSINGAVTTGSYYLNPSLSTVTGLYIDWVSAKTFTFGYLTAGNTLVPDNTVTFGGTSTIGSDIGFYGDLRATDTSLGDFSGLTIEPAPEPSALALCGMGLAGIATLVRRKSK